MSVYNNHQTYRLFAKGFNVKLEETIDMTKNQARLGKYETDHRNGRGDIRNISSRDALQNSLPILFKVLGARRSCKVE